MKKFKLRDLMVFIVLSATVAIAYQLPYLRYTFYDQMMAALQLNNTQMGVMATAISLTSTICYPIGGVLANKFSLRNLIIITLAAFAVLTVWYAFSTNYIALLIIHVLYGFFGIATLWSAYLTGIRNLADESSQSKMFGSSEATRGIVQTIFGFIFLGIMGAVSAPTLGFKYVLLTGAALTAVFLILAIIFLPRTDSKKEIASEAVTDVQVKTFTFSDVIKNKGVWITIMIVMCAYMIWSLGNGYLTTYTVQVLGISMSLASTLGIVRSYIIVFLAGFLGGFVLDRFTYKGKAFLIMFIVAIALLLGVMLSSAVVPLCIAITLILAFMANVMKSTYWSIMGQAGIPVAMTPLATGVVSFIAFIPEFVVPPICGMWIDQAVAAGDPAVGFYKIFIMLIVFAVVGVFFSIVLSRSTKKLKMAAAAVEAGVVEA
ncbi:MAG: MFS transporter [Actinobacteria bacterium]|nr:MFS transporter [Actinomycetota bacterium]